MKKTKTAGNRKWVGKAMIAFVAGLAVLTFFSNTIMNATIPRVVASNAGRSNLSYTNNATAQLVAADEVKVKGLDGRHVASVLYTNYDYVQAGEVILTLTPAEESTTLADLRTQLETSLREREYAERTPYHAPDYYTELTAIHTAELAVDDAQANLVAAQNRDAAISNAQQVLAGNSAALVSLRAQLTAASATFEGIRAQIATLESQIAGIDAAIASLTNPTPTPTPAVTPDPDVTPTASPSTAPTPSGNIDALLAQKAALQAQIATLQAQLPGAQSVVDGLSAQIASAETALSNAQAALTEAENLPTIYAAEDALAAAQHTLSTAITTYEDAIINNGIAADKNQDAIDDRNQKIEDLEAQIAELEAELAQTEIVAPISGYVFNLSVEVDDELNKDKVVFSIIPENTEFTVSFKFPTEVAEAMSVGQELDASQYYWIDRLIIINIKPDPDNPRANRIVKCSVVSNSVLFPGESVTVTANRGNSTYDHVIAASALNEDNTGTFVFVVEQSSTPLGDRYTVRRVSVTVAARSGSLVAITGEGLDGVMIVTRSEEPLHNGDRVRLEDYSSAS
ncbi:MAG: HlyD family efflux transporter periplasmic adaptor subunit [Saccharofermentans sp.]|nr:HlyD family efflux transporter periplasmic adaptor subunit [Saccharofermentans sp.]